MDVRCHYEKDVVWDECITQVHVHDLCSASSSVKLVCVQVRTLIRTDFNSALNEFDVLIAPVAATPAYRFGEKTEDPLAMYLGDQMTVNLNMAGLPAVSLNCGFYEDEAVKLPIGMQLIGKHLSEPQLLGVAHILELTHAPARVFPN